MARGAVQQLKAGVHKLRTGRRTRLLKGSPAMTGVAADSPERRPGRDLNVHFPLTSHGLPHLLPKHVSSRAARTWCWPR